MPTTNATATAANTSFLVILQHRIARFLTLKRTGVHRRASSPLRRENSALNSYSQQPFRDLIILCDFLPRASPESRGQKAEGRNQRSEGRTGGLSILTSDFFQCPLSVGSVIRCAARKQTPIIAYPATNGHAGVNNAWVVLSFR